MRFELNLGPPDDQTTRSIEVSDPYVDLVYGPAVGAMAVLVLRYLHASLPLRTNPICSIRELAEATGSRPRRMFGPLGRLERHGLIITHRPIADELEAPVGRIILPRGLPPASPATVDRLPPLARSVARKYSGD